MSAWWLFKLAAMISLSPAILATAITTLTKTFAWLVNHHSAHDEQDITHPDLDFKHFLNVLAFEIVHANWWIYHNIYFRLNGQTSPLNAHLNSTPIILVHGFLDTPYAWRWFKKTLGKEMEHPVYTHRKSRCEISV